MVAARGVATGLAIGVRFHTASAGSGHTTSRSANSKSPFGYALDSQHRGRFRQNGRPYARQTRIPEKLISPNRWRVAIFTRAQWRTIRHNEFQKRAFQGALVIQNRSTKFVGWSIVAYGFVAVAISATARALLSLAMPLWEAEQGWSRSLISLAGALALVVMALTAPIAGNFIDRFGPRKLLTAGFVILGLGLLLTTVSVEPWQLLLSFGVVSGIGFGVVAVIAFFAAIAPYFIEQRGFAMAVVDSGSDLPPVSIPVILPRIRLQG